MGLLNSLFGKKENKIVEYLNKKAILLDVRTAADFNNKSIKGAKHIPLDMLQSHLKELKGMNGSFIVYCASGMRSGKATSFLLYHNIDAINGGGMSSLSTLIK